jgi:hypothetical protein
MFDRIVCLSTTADDYAVYRTGARGPHRTPLMFRGSLADCIQWRRDHS